MNKTAAPDAIRKRRRFHVYGALVVRVSSSRIKWLAAVLPMTKSWRTDMTAPSIDVLQAKVHLYSLEPEHDHHLWLATDDKQSKRPAKAFFGTLDELLERFNRLQSNGFAIHVCVNAMRGRRRRIAETQRIRALYAEMDREPHKAFPIKPIERKVMLGPNSGQQPAFWFKLRGYPEYLWPLIPSRPGTVHYADIIRALDAFLTPNDLLTLDAGTNRIWATTNLCLRTPHQLIAPGGIGGMGWSTPAATAVKLNRPGNRVTGVVGDGGFVMTMDAVATAAELNLDVVFLVANNAGLGMVRDNLGRLRLTLPTTISPRSPKGSAAKA